MLATGLAASPISFLHNAVLNAYAACGEVDDARNVFDGIPGSHKDTIDWTTMMGCLTRCGAPFSALNLFAEMQKEEGLKADDLTLVCVLKACAQLLDLTVGKQGHGWMVKMGFGRGSIKACNALMDMYVKNGSMAAAKRVFDEMEERSVVSWTVILDGLVRWESLGKARLLLDEMPERNEVTWTIMVAAYVESGFANVAFQLLNEMVFTLNLKLNHVMLCSIVGASAQSGDVMIGKWTHVYALKTMEDIDVMMGTALLDMYAKCGRIRSALNVFECMPWRNVVAWNAMISGLAMHGRGTDVLDMFPRMLEEVNPDDLTFSSILNACSHAGLVEEGRSFFQNLEPQYGLKPKLEHYASMVDLLGRAGRVEEAEMVIRTMPMPPNEVVLGSLLGSCFVHRKLHLGERILKQLVEFDPENTEYHVMLSNFYASEGRLEMANGLRQALKTRGIRKTPGISSIHVNGKLHQFCAGDKSHSKTRQVYSMLDEMIKSLKITGYVPNTSSQVLGGGIDNGINEEEEKEQAVIMHSEKLALCFGLISTRAGTPIYIFKNLRICVDCHSAIRIASKVYEREIVVRDRSRFHCFKHGSCSCSDYW